MKILQINTTVNSGSTGRIAEDLGNAFLDKGHESYIAFGRGNSPSQSRLMQIGNQWDTYGHGFKTAIFDRHGFGSKKATKDLVQKIEKIRPDAVGLHNIHGYYLNIEVLFDYLQNKEIPIIWTLHDAWSFTGHCTYYDSVGCEKWKSQCHDCPKTKKYPASYFLDQSKRNYLDKKRIFNQVKNLHLITPSKWLANEVNQSFLNSNSLKVIHNGIDLEVFRPRQKVDFERIKKSNQIIASKKILLGVANLWDKRKGLDDFIQLNKLVKENFQIVLIGLSSKQIKSLPSGILGIPRTESIEELSVWYSIAEAFINLTYQDNFPTTNLEALACGTPVITFRTGGSPEAVDDSTGFVVEKGDLEGVLQAIDKISSNGKLSYQISCRSRAEKLFNKKDRYLDYLNLYESIVHGLE